MAKPSVLPLWNTAEERVLAPTATQRATGWVWTGSKFEKPKGETLNYWMNNVGKWVKYFDEEVVPTSPIASPEEYTALGGETSILTDDNTNIQLYKNDVFLEEGTDYTLNIDGVTVDLVVPLAVNDFMQWYDLKKLNNSFYTKAELDKTFNLVKVDPNAVLFVKSTPSSITIPTGTIIKNRELPADYTLDLNTDLDTGTKTAGTDYYVYAKADGSFYLSSNNTLGDKIIGGFHYGLTPEAETLPASALKTEADMVTSRGIKAYSMWDLTWKPANKRPEGKVLVNNIFWRDIYPADEDYAIRGYSSCFAIDGVTPAKLAGGNETSGRKFPKIPLSKGGNGTINYGSLTWYDANEIVSEVGMRMISYDEFSNSSYGVVEEQSLEQLGYTVGTGVIQHYPELESKWGVEMAVGVQYFWGSQIMNGYGTTDFAHRSGLTDGRGQLYATSNSPVATRFGGYELSNSTTRVAGSRNLDLTAYVWINNENSGFVAVCNHINLNK